MNIVQILYIPTGDYVVSRNRPVNNNSVLFANIASAEKMVSSIVNHTAYIGGAPLNDFSVGAMPVSTQFYAEEFEYIPVKPTDFYPQPRILDLS